MKPPQPLAPKNWLAPLKTVRQWFDEYLDRSDPRPSDLALTQIARDIQIQVNCCHNLRLAHFYSPELPPQELLKDSDAHEETDRRRKIALNLASAAREKAARLSDYARDLEEYEHGDQLDILSNDLPRAPRGPSEASGRHREAWHAAAPRVAEIIIQAMDILGYRGRLGAKSEESLTAHVGAKAVSWAYGIDIQAKGFASAMTRRDRTKKLTDEEAFLRMFPEAARLQPAK